MLQIAKGKEIFQRIICEYLGLKRLDIEDGMIKTFCEKISFLVFYIAINQQDTYCFDLNQKDILRIYVMFRV